MLRNLKQIEGRALHARDGVIGEVKDFYFDDHHWHVRYIVVQTGSWLSKRRVLVAPHTLAPLDWGLQVFPVDLTVEQVRNSPDVDTEKPVSRQQEITLRQHYGWPPYWGGMSDAGGLAAPMMGPQTAAALQGGYNDGRVPLQPRGDPHLRSANDTRGYHIRATDGLIGHLEDYLVDDTAWQMRYLVVDTRNWLPGKKVILAPAWITQVSWATRSVSADLTREAVKGSPPYDPSSTFDPAYAATLHDYYRRPRYSDWDDDITAGAPKRDRAS